MPKRSNSKRQPKTRRHSPSWHTTGSPRPGPQTSTRPSATSGAPGDAARDTLAPDDAIRWYQQALDLVARQTPPDEHQRAELLAELGTAQRQAAHPEYRDTLLEAATLAQQLDDTDILVQAALGSPNGPREVGDDGAKPVIRAALDRIDTDPTATRARLLAALAAAHDASLEWQTRRDLSREAVDIARGAGDDATFVDMIDTACTQLATPDHRDQVVDDVARAVAMADRIGDPVLRARIRFPMMWAQYQRADIVGADTVLSEMEALTQIVGLPHPRWQHAIVAIGRLLLDGHVDQAETANERVIEIGTAAGMPEALGVFGGVLFVIRQHQGRLDEIADFFIDAARDNPSIAVLRATVIFMLCELGRTDEAHERLAVEATTGFDFPYDITWLDSMHSLADSAATIGDESAARVLVERLAPFASHVVLQRQFSSAVPSPVRSPVQPRSWATTAKPKNGSRRHTRSTPASKHRSILRSANSTTPTFASPAAPTATSNAHATSHKPPQQPLPSTAAEDSPNAPPYFSATSDRSVRLVRENRYTEERYLRR